MSTFAPFICAIFTAIFFLENCQKNNRFYVALLGKIGSRILILHIILTFNICHRSYISYTMGENRRCVKLYEKYACWER